MNEQKLRSEVAKRRKQLRRSEEKHVPDRTWEYLEEMGFVDEADAKEDPISYLVHQIDRIAAAAPASSARGASKRARETRKDLTPQLGDYEKERARVFEEALAKVAVGDPRLQNYRTEILDGAVLTPERADRFIASPAAAHFPVTWFKELGIALVDHDATAETVERGHDDVGPYKVLEVSVRPSGIIRRVKTRSFPGDSYTWLAVGQISVHLLSPLGLLQGLSSWFARHYPWDESEAARFVLTDQIPVVPPLTSEVRIYGNFEGSPFSYGTVTLNVAPWMSAEALKNAFRDLQRRYILGQDLRRLGDKTLKLLRFVTERIDPTGPAPRGRELVARWNRENPQWAYSRDTRRFWRDYNRARQSVLLPPYVWRD